MNNFDKKRSRGKLKQLNVKKDKEELRSDWHGELNHIYNG